MKSVEKQKESLVTLRNLSETVTIALDGEQSTKLNSMQISNYILLITNRIPRRFLHTLSTMQFIMCVVRQRKWIRLLILICEVEWAKHDV